MVRIVSLITHSVLPVLIGISIASASAQESEAPPTALPRDNDVPSPFERTLRKQQGMLEQTLKQYREYCIEPQTPMMGEVDCASMEEYIAMQRDSMRQTQQMQEQLSQIMLQEVILPEPGDMDPDALHANDCVSLVLDDEVGSDSFVNQCDRRITILFFREGTGEIASLELNENERETTPPNTSAVRALSGAKFIACEYPRVPALTSSMLGTCE